MAELVESITYLVAGLVLGWAMPSALRWDRHRGRR
jgi:hypothetical protein